MSDVEKSIHARELRWRELWQLLTALRALDEPLTSPEGLRGALTAIARIARLWRIGDEPIAWLERVASDEALLRIIAAALAYFWSERPSRDKVGASALGVRPAHSLATAEIARFLAALEGGGP